MKKFLYLTICITCICILTACKSEKEKLAEDYILANDYVYAENIADAAHSKIVGFGIENFNSRPVDTLYKWQIFEKYDMQCALDIYMHDINELNGMYAFRQGMTDAFGDLYCQ